MIEMDWGFFITIIVTIVITRVWLYITHKLLPTINFVNASPKVGGIKMHHYMYGIVILIIGYISNNQYILAIGLGLIIDELSLVIQHRGNKFHWEEYWSLSSLIGILISLMITYIIVRITCSY